MLCSKRKKRKKETDKNYGRKTNYWYNTLLLKINKKPLLLMKTVFYFPDFEDINECLNGQKISKII